MCSLNQDLDDGGRVTCNTVWVFFIGNDFSWQYILEYYYKIKATRAINNTFFCSFLCNILNLNVMLSLSGSRKSSQLTKMSSIHPCLINLYNLFHFMVKFIKWKDLNNTLVYWMGLYIKTIFRGTWLCIIAISVPLKLVFVSVRTN